MLNPHGVATYSVTLADAVGKVIDGGEFPVVLWRLLDPARLLARRTPPPAEPIA